MIKISSDTLQSLIKYLSDENIKYIGYFSEDKIDKNFSFDSDSKDIRYTVLISSQLGQFYTYTNELAFSNLIKVDKISITNHTAEIS